MRQTNHYVTGLKYLFHLYSDENAYTHGDTVTRNVTNMEEHKTVKTRKYILTLMLLMFGMTKVDAQNYRERYEAFRQQARQNYESFRDKANKEYADFMKQAWQRFRAEEPEPLPFEKPMPPIVCPDDNRQEPPIDEQKPFNEVTVIPDVPEQQPQPIEPVKPQSDITESDTLNIVFYGTPIQIIAEKLPDLKMQGVKENEVSAGWKNLSSGKNDILLANCLNIRKQYKLNDWGYLQF